MCRKKGAEGRQAPIYLLDHSRPKRKAKTQRIERKREEKRGREKERKKVERAGESQINNSAKSRSLAYWDLSGARILGRLRM